MRGALFGCCVWSPSSLIPAAEHPNGTGLREDRMLRLKGVGDDAALDASASAWKQDERAPRASRARATTRAGRCHHRAVPVGRSGDVFVIDTVHVGTVSEPMRFPIPGDFRYATRLVIEAHAESADVPMAMASMDLRPLDSFDGARWHTLPPIGSEFARMSSNALSAVLRVVRPFAPRLALSFTPNPGTVWHGVELLVASYAGTSAPSG
jgi:hypothetical protein